MFPAKSTPAVIKEAQELKELGVSLTKIGLKFGVHSMTVKRWVDPQYAKKCNDEVRLRNCAVNLRRATYERLVAEAARREISVRALIHELIEQGLPKSLPEAAE